MKKILCIPFILLFTSFIFKKIENDESKVIGTWNWSSVLNPKTNEINGIEDLTMGVGKKVKTIFFSNHTYNEIKFRSEKDSSIVKGEWKLESENILSLKSKDKWRPSKIVKLNHDTLILEMNPMMNLILTKK